MFVFRVFGLHTLTWMVDTCGGSASGDGGGAAVLFRVSIDLGGTANEIHRYADCVARGA